MPIQVKAPDGSIAQFPDGMSDSAITAVMAKEYPQPSIMQDIAASPPGRLIHDAFVQPLEGLSSLATRYGTRFLAGPTVGNVAGDATNNILSKYVEQPYQNALAAQRNVPGYADARAQADAQMQRMGAGGLGDQLLAPITPAIAGANGALLGGSMNAANASADAQSTAQADYAKAHPILSAAAQFVGGLAMGAPESAMSRSLSAAAAAPKPLAQVAPSIADLKQAAKVAYDKVDNSGLVVSGPSYDGMVSGLQTKLANEGIDPTLHPNALAAYNRLAGAQGQNITIKGLDTMRRVAGDAIGASATNPADARMSGIVQDAIDDHVNNLQPSDLIGVNGAAPPNPTQTISDLGDARDLWNRASQAGTIQSEIDKAGIQASANYSQSGVENALRQRFKSLALNDNKMARLSPDVQTAVKQVASGSPMANVLRAVGKYAPHGPIATSVGMGLGYTLGGIGGATEGGLASVAVPMIGEAARAGATAMTKSAAQRALDIAALGRTRTAPLSVPPLQLPSITPQARLPYGLFGSGLFQQQVQQP